MASEKTVNYTPEQTAEMVAAYTADKSEATVKMLAEKFGKTVRSVVAKLAREQVYVGKAKAKAAGTHTKADLVADIESRFEMKEGTLETLEKGSKDALEALFAAVCTDR